MVIRSLHLTMLRSIAQRRIRRSSDPVQRAFAVVVVARTIADVSAVEHARRGGPAVEFASAERVLDAAMEHLRQVRAAAAAASTGHGRLPAGQTDRA